jgi:O-antigen ligase
MTSVPFPRVELRQLREGTGQVLRAARERPTFALYLIALGLLPIKWLSPFADAQAGWTDVFFAAAAVAWAVEKVRARARPHLRPVHYGLALYLLAGVLSAAVASSDPSVGRENVLIMAELVALFVLTSDFGRDDSCRRAIALLVLFATLVTAVLAVLALGLFYAHVDTNLVWIYGDLEPSDLYARVAAGFNSAPLLGSFCIFASAVVADRKSGLPDRVRAMAQVILLVLVVLTISRALVGFLVAAAIRFAAARGTRMARRVAIGAVIASLLLAATLTLGRLSVDPSKPASASYSLLDESDSPRLAAVESSAETFADRPLLGSGPGSLAGVSEGAGIRAHLTPLNVAATLGLPALAALAFAVLAIWRRRLTPTNVAIWSGLVGLGIDALTEDVEHFRHVWILLGLADADRRDD